MHGTRAILRAFIMFCVELSLAEIGVSDHQSVPGPLVIKQLLAALPPRIPVPARRAYGAATRGLGTPTGIPPNNGRAGLHVARRSTRRILALNCGGKRPSRAVAPQEDLEAAKSS